MKPTTAVIGLGNIGGGVARNLLRDGYEVRISDLDDEKVQAVQSEGGIPGPLEETVPGTEIVFTSLPGPHHVAEVGAEILPIMAPGSVWVDLSTNDRSTISQLGRECQARGVGLVDAPVSGGPEGAHAGTLSIFVGGDDPDVARVRPLLNVIGDRIYHLGPPGAGVVAKIAQVTLCYTQTVALTEALLLGVKGGVDPEKMLDLIQNSAGRSYVSQTYGPEILAGTYDASFPISHAAKDMRLAIELAADVDAELPFMAAVAELYERTEGEYGPAAAHLLAAQMIEKQNHVILHHRRN